MPDSLRIATFNLESLGADDLDERIAILRPQLARLRADVLCLQEVDGQRGASGKQRSLTALEALLAETPYATYHHAHTRSLSTGGARDRHNLVLLSRFPLRQYRQVRHDFVPAPSYRSPGEPSAAQPIEWDRSLLQAELALDGGRTLHVLNVHLRAPRAAYVPGGKTHPPAWDGMTQWAEGMFLAAVKRAGQTFEARLLIDQILDREPEALIAVCGDFNADLYQTPVRTIRGDEEDAANPHLVGRILVPLEKSLSHSQRYSVVHHGRPQMLDHVLVSRPLLGWYRHSEIHNEALGDELVGSHAVPGGPESYHAPVVAEFEIPDA
ncbi:endonuclease/exonuclease/phosphatase family protein [Magnetospira thiophila]